MKTFYGAALILTLAFLLPACTETRVIRDNTLDAKFGRSMPGTNIQRAGQVAPKNMAGSNANPYH